MVKKNRVIAVSVAIVVVIAVVGVLLGIKGNPAGTAKSRDGAQAAQSVDKAEVTGYTSSPLTSRPSGPVSVLLHGASAARIDQLIKGLPVANPLATCAEEAQLYRIDFAVVAGAKRGFDAAGYECGGLVVITSDGKTVLRTDRNCTLMSAVRRLLPATATATQRLSVPCVS
jgi:hypothetical protein